MSLKSIKLLEVSLTQSNNTDILEYIQKRLIHGVKNTVKTEEKTQKIISIVTPNPEQIVLSTKSSQFLRILNWADISLPDGLGIVWAVKYLGLDKDFHRLHGIDFMEDLVKISAEKSVPIALIGGRNGLAELALECLVVKNPKIKGWAVDGPKLIVTHDELYIGEAVEKERYFEQLTNKIIDTKVRFVFLAFGAPKQEMFMAELKKHLQTKNITRSIVLMVVGGSFDYISGKVQRAPIEWRKIGLEWLYRLIQQPWRWKRQLTLIYFILLVFKQKIRNSR